MFKNKNQDDALYRQLQIQLDQYPIGYPATNSGIEIELLKYFFTPDQAKVALCLTLPAISISKIRRNYKSLYHKDIAWDELSALLEGMFQKGVIRRSTEAKEPRYGIAMLAIGMFEYQVDALTPELMEMMHKYLDEAFGAEFFRASLPQLRTSPHLAAIVPEYIVEPYDNLRHFLSKTSKPLFVSNCVCKQGEALLGKPCRQTQNIEVCLMIGESNHAQRRRARKISKEEALAILEEADEKGMVLQPSNSRDPACICICCGCCCGVLTAAKKEPQPARFFASNYYAAIDASLCKNCGICVKRCPMDAVLVEEDRYRVNLDRCIGCGLCVTRCKPKAALLVKKASLTVPPRNTEVLYLKILREKAGRKKMMINMLRMLLGKPL
ncbi:MAG TPA: 4Fe-4S binding protein [Smithellaceae bacterium]|nr:4Fe-4S binding protein [Smithellaceae bacterium]